MNRLMSIAVILTTFSICSWAEEPTLQLQLRSQHEIAADSNLYHRTDGEQQWDPARTAVIVCDMWDSHHCYNAVQRAAEMSPRMNAVLKELRRRGATVIHAPSGCMETYQDHPARKRAIQAPQADDHPQDIAKWCYQIPSEEQADYPVDQSDGGSDDTPEQHAAWKQELIDRGLDPQRPWQRQIEALEIDSQRDYISDSGVEIWNVLSDRQIDNVILTGVHTNMCVLGRPFGLRRMAAAGKNVVLLRDLTDTMYNPAAAPFVSHFTGTDLIIDHIERFVCPTITSDQIVGGAPFRFTSDRRPRLAILIGESEYHTETTLPAFAKRHLGQDYQVDLIHADKENGNHFPGLDRIADADLLLVSVRRRPLGPEQLQQVRDFVNSGKPVLGIRTANHAFTLRNKPAPEGYENWPEWDREVFGGNYSNHYGNRLKATIRTSLGATSHPILARIQPTPFAAGGSLYRVSPLAEGATELMTGAVTEQPPEPVAWTYRRADGGVSFYTSLGHRDEFDHPAFEKLLKNAIDWAASQVPDA